MKIWEDPRAEVIIPVPILGPPDGPPIDRWFAVKLQDDEGPAGKKAAAATGRGAPNKAAAQPRREPGGAPAAACFAP